MGDLIFYPIEIYKFNEGPRRKGRYPTGRKVVEKPVKEKKPTFKDLTPEEQHEILLRYQEHRRNKYSLNPELYINRVREIQRRKKEEQQLLYEEHPEMKPLPKKRGRKIKA